MHCAPKREYIPAFAGGEISPSAPIVAGKLNLQAPAFVSSNVTNEEPAAHYFARWK
jgi:hypothetical protein